MKRLTYFDGGKWRLKIGDTEYSGEAVDRRKQFLNFGMLFLIFQATLTASAHWPRLTRRGSSQSTP